MKLCEMLELGREDEAIRKVLLDAHDVLAVEDSERGEVRGSTQHCDRRYPSYQTESA